MYTPRPLPQHAAYFSVSSDAYGETTFTCPGIMVTEAYANSDIAPQVWNYRYNVNDSVFTSQGLGAWHTSEAPAIFGGDVGSVDNTYDTVNANIVPVVMNYWTSFVRSLDPNPYKYASAPEWDSYGTQKNRLLFQTNDSYVEQVPAAQSARCAAWRNLAVKMEQK
jgi:acetylcholinesterase